MIQTATKKGFTLVELLVVMAIGMMLFATMGAGIFYLQNSVRLDNSIRDLKVQIQAAQNNARNSFITNEATLSDSSLGNRKVSVGWVADISNSGNSIVITRRSVYFIPGNSYDFTQLRTHIDQNLKNKQANFFCINDQLYSVVGNVRTTIKFAGMPSNEILRCSSDVNEKFTTTFAGITLDDKNEGISNCTQTIDGVKRVSLFFTSGYGETVFANTDNCQIKIKNSNGIIINGRSIYIAKNTGSLGTCGVYCTPGEVTGIETVVTVVPTNAPACSAEGQACGNGCCTGLSCNAVGKCAATAPSCAGVGQACGAANCCSGLSCIKATCKLTETQPGPGPEPF